MKVLSIPHIDQLSPQGESGIHTVIRSYFSFAGKYDIQFVSKDDEFDLVAIHAGMGKFQHGLPVVSHLHGLYWTADFSMPGWAYRSNEHIVNTLRLSTHVTVPSRWVAETLQRDMHWNPYILPHGVDFGQWYVGPGDAGYVIGYAKNRAGVDVCNPSFLLDLCPKFPGLDFYATFAPEGIDNAKVTGLLPHNDMKSLVQGCRVFINTTKETFGIAMLEAMAAGKPVLAYNHGGAVDIVQHGVTGYLAEPDNVDDLAAGLAYCLEHSHVLGSNAAHIVSTKFTWEAATERLSTIYHEAVVRKPPLVSIVIPVYNKEKHLERAVNSALGQDSPVHRVVIVNDGSTDNSRHIGKSLAEDHDKVIFIDQENQGVAHARNAGIAAVPEAKYIVCLDADDWIDHRFVGACLTALEEDRSLGIAYTGLTAVREDGEMSASRWPSKWDYEQQLRKRNQVPTCCMFRRDLWERLGGYRQRYAPTGAGSEDAEFWTRIGAIGYGAKQVTTAGLFYYQFGGQVSSDPNYREVDWLYWHPWVSDKSHPFASQARPNRRSHPVRQYDEPVVSVIIPVGPNHQQYLVDALDSLEAQTLRQWEVILVNDAKEDFDPGISKAYPFIRLLDLQSGKGAGFARNRGVEVARAPFLLFLDADDWLYPTAIAKMLKSWGANEAGIYSDYLGIAHVEDPGQLTSRQRKEMLYYDSRRKLATIRHYAADFDPDRAAAQPQNPPYLWCNVTTLIPTAWHYEIDGFDESMVSWEDVDYWYRMAWSGKCFCRIPEPLLVYRFFSGERRDSGGRNWDDLISYIRKKNVRLQK